MKPWLIGGLVVAALALYGLGRRDARLAREVMTWRQNAEQAIAATQGYEKVLDSLRRVETKLRATSGRIRLRVDTIRLRAETLLVHGDTAAALVQMQDALASCRQGWIATEAAGETCRIRATLAEARAAHLDSLLRTGLRVQSCKILFVRCPSRSLVFVGGILGGFLLGRR